MAGHWSVGTISAEAREAGDDETGICNEQVVWVEANRFKYTRTKRIDENVGVVEEGFEKGKAIRGSQV